MKYRREIDGLRSVAVLPVIFFHAGIGAFAGGYLGVDVFFVISGYLITGIILDELARGQFSLLRFYERRTRRILPALSVVVVACLPMAWFYTLPDPLQNFGQSVVATMLSLNNVLLTLTSGYWDLASEFKPLIHTWSLAVEEQFYILFPPILMGFYPLLKHRTIIVVLGIVIASFTASIFLVGRYPESTFYLLHTRAWELGIGALGAFWEHRRRVEACEGLSLLGLGAILASVFLFDEHTQHPSYLTAIPVLGTLLVLLFGKNGTWVARILGVKVMVGIGLISYSLYLWHQPLFAFARILSFEQPETEVFFGLVLLTVVLSYLTWRFVEQPFRRQSVVSTQRLVAASAMAVIGMSTLGLSLHLGQGFPGRIFSSDREIAAGMHIDYNHRISRYNDAQFDHDDGDRVLIIGNSQARDFANVLLELGVMDDVQLVYRSDLPLCEPPTQSAADARLVARADIIFYPIIDLSRACERYILADDAARDNTIFVGPKHFGYNLNAFVRLPEEGRPDYTARIFDEIISANVRNAALVPFEQYIDLINYASENGTRIRIFDARGDIISADRVHITRAGARFFANRIMDHPALDFFD